VIQTECAKRQLPVYIVPKRPAAEDVQGKPAPFFMRHVRQPYLANIVISDSENYIQREAKEWGYTDMKSISDADLQACGVMIMESGVSKEEFSSNVDRIFRSWAHNRHRIYFKNPPLPVLAPTLQPEPKNIKTTETKTTETKQSKQNEQSLSSTPPTPTSISCVNPKNNPLPPSFNKD
jgi:hypothetical protein